jgi:hypothetical protein
MLGLGAPTNPAAPSSSIGIVGTGGRGVDPDDDEAAAAATSLVSSATQCK